MRYRKTCALYDEVNMGNPGNVPWCSDKGLEPNCENCTRPDKTNYDRLTAMNLDELAFELAVDGCPPFYSECPAKKEPEEHSNCVKCWLDWLKSPVEVDNG